MTPIKKIRFSLCIPTKDRYSHFLKHTLPQYLNNSYIDDIIVVDENGHDFQHIARQFNHPKLKLYKNIHVLGPFLNKLKAASLATHDWIALIDSDNFVDESYFQVAHDYLIEQAALITPQTILMPSFAKPAFDYRHLAPVVITKQNIKQVLGAGVEHGETIMNTGNYIINQYLIEHVNIVAELPYIPMSCACDVIYLNTLFLEQFDLTIHVVKHLEYVHNIHGDCTYVKTHYLYQDFNESIYQRFRKFTR